ncbi:MAG: MaoC family dehydratase N-terminal domain-containing protein [Gammaproteobacteria bacterium]|nr:MaoC family dehydratase N-terminal domain-containing protein [Gammaproteobacteria bacterium]
MDDIEAIKGQFLNHQFDERQITLENPQSMAEFAKACGETLPKFTDPADADFQATPAFASGLGRGRNLPEDFPTFGGVAMDGGKDVQPIKPLRPGMSLTGKCHVHDIYAKTGRSGRMIFVISRMEWYTDAGELTTIADTRLVIRERPQQ